MEPEKFSEPTVDIPSRNIEAAGRIASSVRSLGTVGRSSTRERSYSMRRLALNLALALASAASTVAFAAPAAAAPATVSSSASASVVTDDGWRHHRRFGRFGFGGFGFPVVSPFFTGGFGFGGGGFGFDGGGCQIFLWTGDINSYVLCRVG